MKATAPKLSKEEKLMNQLMELISTLINYKWNCTNRTGIITRFIRIMGAEFSNLQAMLEHLEAEQTRMDGDKHSYGFNNYYGQGIIQTMKDIIALAPKLANDNTVFPGEQIVGMNIRKAFKNSYLYKDFNWDNFESLREAGMLSVVGEFDTDFRGNIAKIHKVHEEKYAIVETKRFPFDYDKQKYKRNEPEEINFYAFNKTDKGYQHSSTVYHTFEDALFSVICPTYSSAMSALLAQSNLYK